MAKNKKMSQARMQQMGGKGNMARCPGKMTKGTNGPKTKG